MKEKIKNIINRIKKNEFWSSLFKNSFIAVIGEGGASFINLFVVIFLIKLIGSEGYGILILAQTYMTIVDTIINLQCWRGVIKYGEEAKIKKNIEELYGYIKLGSLIDLLTAVIGTVVCFLLVNLTGRLLDWNNLTIISAKIFSIVIVSHFSGTPTAILRMENKFNLKKKKKIFASAIKLGTLLIIYILQGSLTVLSGVIIYVVTDILSNLMLILMAVWVVHKNYGLKKVIKAKLPSKTKEFTRFTIWTSLSDVTDIPVNYFDVFIISKLGLELVSVFKVFKQIIALISKLAIPIYQAIFPQFSKLTASDKLEEAYNAVKRIQKFVVKYIMPLFIIVGLTSYYWLDIVFGSLYRDYWYVLLAYIVIHTISISFTTIHPLFISMGKVKEDFIYVLITNLAYFVVALVLVKYLGMFGIVISYAVQSFSIILLKKIKIEKILKEST